MIDLLLRSTENIFVTVDVTKAIQTTPEFRRMSFAERECYYPDEKKLRLFPVCSDVNCAYVFHGA